MCLAGDGGGKGFLKNRNGVGVELVGADSVEGDFLNG